MMLCQSFCIAKWLCHMHTYILFFFFFVFPVAHGVPGPRIRSKHSCNLCCSCGNTRSLTHSAGVGIEPASLQRQHTNPVVPQQEFPFFFFFPPSWSVLGYWIWFPGLCSRTSLLIHSKSDSLHLLTLHFQSIPPLPPSPLATTSLFSISVSLFQFCR